MIKLLTSRYPNLFLRRKIAAYIKKREGVRYEVYLDSLGKPTAGVGHLLLPNDKLSVGDKVSNAQVNKWLDHDLRWAIDAALSDKLAIEYAQNITVSDELFIKLVSVNFQLGPRWNEDKFPRTWGHMLRGNWTKVIKNIENSLWARQTPARTASFINSLRQEFLV